MARWQPQSDRIESNEVVGRRLFDGTNLIGADDQISLAPDWLLTNFQDKRRDRQWSVDRMGRGNCEKKVVNYLKPRCAYHAESFQRKKIFNGWLCVAVKHILDSQDPVLPVEPSPVVSEEANPSPDNNLLENCYHAHVILPENMNSLISALYLRHLFQQHGEAHLVEPSQANENGSPIITVE